MYDVGSAFASAFIVDSFPDDLPDPWNSNGEGTFDLFNGDESIDDLDLSGFPWRQPTGADGAGPSGLLDGAGDQGLPDSLDSSGFPWRNRNRRRGGGAV
ncbi:hypothetical protein GPECTOR_209g409 [Gonium pectorale]|uniref:Uncharacterized protein n=1 Tax=Gonium pectorale TaxID=33097 RepID=A0A150FWU5_GONPE|nr:hypothetical protein GPECTOR_209g409 [Gonium pectorale]|eukprot:KXZ42081.1 hypothetical protein GPECTOR_209g409 [Gonium pectorale]